MPTASSSRYAIEMLACWLSFVTFNLGWVAMTSPKVDRWRRMRFVCMMWPQQFLAIVSRFLVMRLVKLASWEGLDHPALYWPLLLPIGVFETWSIQAMADVFESRPVKPVCLKQVLNQLKITTAESIGVTVGYKIWPWVRIDDPTLESLLHATWRTFVFDIGLDIGFYTFHRVCHVNRTLYRWLHAQHHTDTAKEHGHLVAHETYEVSLVEAISILGSYLIGFELIGLLYNYTLFDIALLVSWAHLVELLGHTQMSWTVNGHPLRIIPEVLNLDLKVPDHTMHHTKPLSNFSKRLTLIDRALGTYEPPGDEYGTITLKDLAKAKAKAA